MKKIFTLIAVASLGFSAYASDYKLMHNGQALEDGATYEAGYVTSEQELMPGMTIYTVTYDAELMLQASPSVEMAVQVKASPTQVQFCGFDGQCVMVGAAGKTKTGKTTSSNPENLSIDIVIDDMTGYKYLSDTATAVVTAYPTSNSADATTVTVKFVNKPASEIAGIGNIAADMADSTVEYYSLLGQKVTRPIPGQVLIRRQAGKTQKVLIK